MINKIALAGCGNVGTALLEILHDKKDLLKERYGFEYKVVLVSDLMKGVALDANGIDLDVLLDNLHARKPIGAADTTDLGTLLDKSGATVLAECTPTDVQTGEPGLSHFRAALTRGVSVTTTNKGPIAVAFDELRKLAAEHGAKIGYEGVVMSGTPLLDMAENGLAGCSVLGVEGILNGTTNFILTRMDEGASYADALTEAIEKGYAEADPTGDIEGWDAAVKVVILAKLLYNKNISVYDVVRIGIAQMKSEQMEMAHRNGYRVKLIAGISFDANGVMRPYVMPKELPLSHPLASIGGATNAVTLKTDNLGDVTLIGPGAGRRETGQALLSDMIRMNVR